MTRKNWNEKRVIEAAQNSKHITVKEVHYITELIHDNGISIKLTLNGPYRSDIPKVYTVKMPWKDVAKLLELSDQ